MFDLRAKVIDVSLGDGSRSEGEGIASCKSGLVCWSVRFGQEDSALDSRCSRISL